MPPYHYEDESTVSESRPWTDKLGQKHVDLSFFAETEIIGIVDPDPTFHALHNDFERNNAAGVYNESTNHKPKGRPKRLSKSGEDRVPRLKESEYELSTSEIIDKRMPHLIDALIEVINGESGHVRKDAILRLIEMSEGKPGTKKAAPSADTIQDEEFEIIDDIDE